MMSRRQMPLSSACFTRNLIVLLNMPGAMYVASGYAKVTALAERRCPRVVGCAEDERPRRADEER